MANTRLSRRQQQLRWTIALLLTAAAIGVLASVLIYERRRPEGYRPGEDNPDITRTLARGIPQQAPEPRFADVTGAAGLDAFRSFAGARTSQLPEDMGAGAAWGDFDNDGHEDLFLVSAGGPLGTPRDQLAPSLLYRNQGDGTFRLVEDFPETRIHGMAAAWGDYTGNGWLDLIVTGYNTLLLFRNEGGRLVRDTSVPDLEGFWAGAAWGDFDNDGHLDLYISGYVHYATTDADRARVSVQYGTAVPYTLNPASYEPHPNLLFRNNGNGTFTEVAGELGVDNPEGRSLGAVWHDFDDDGWLDLYVANDISDNVFYRNLGGTFEEISHAAWVADYRGAMGLAVGDWDRDGDDDLFVTHWIAQENGLYNSLLNDVPGPIRAPGPAVATSAQPAGPPSPRLRFVDAADSVGLGQISVHAVGWGTEFADFDGDGWLDLVVANGSTLETDDQPRRLRPQAPFLFWNHRGQHFYDLAPLSPVLSTPRVARGLAVADFDGDGALDILIMDLDGGAQLLRNEMQPRNWLALRLRSRPVRPGAPPGFADGAKVIAHVDKAVLRRGVTSASYLSQSSRVIHFGLGNATRVDRLEVRWLGGRVSTYENLDANATCELFEGDPTPRCRPPAAASRPPTPPAPALEERERIVRFWKAQRAAMDAMRTHGDAGTAVGLFREALALDPRHEDSRYYLANALAMLGDTDGSLGELEELTRINSRSHRGHKRWGVLRARSARSPADLEAAEQSLLRAYAINPEETGALLILGEVALLRGEPALARERLSHVVQANSRAAGAFFLLGYIAWTERRAAEARRYLEAAAEALGEEWMPAGTTAEGDVLEQAHDDSTPLSRFWETWDKSPDEKGFARLDAFLRSRNR
jgi:enediyne biosynthesis protein E4